MHTFALLQLVRPSAAASHCWVFIKMTSNTWSIITLQPRLSGDVSADTAATHPSLPKALWHHLSTSTLVKYLLLRACVCGSYGWLIFGWQLVGSRATVTWNYKLNKVSNYSGFCGRHTTGATNFTREQQTSVHQPPNWHSVTRCSTLLPLVAIACIY